MFINYKPTIIICNTGFIPIEDPYINMYIYYLVDSKTLTLLYNFWHFLNTFRLI